MNQLLNKAKAIAAFLGAMGALAVTLTELPDWVTVAVTLLTAASVYVIPNQPLDVQPRRALKA